MELLELNWLLERTLALHSTQADLLDRICSAGTFAAADLPQPTKVARQHPGPARPPKTRRKRQVHESQAAMFHDDDE